MRVLVDTNIWIDYLRQTEPVLVDLLERDQVCVHQSVITELALGNLRDRAIFLKLMIVHAVGYRGVRHLLEERRLWGRGLSAVDAALLASVVVTLGSCCGRAINACVRPHVTWACWPTLNEVGVSDEAVAGSSERVARSLAYGESSRSVCVARCAMLLEYQGILAVMARIPVVECAGPSPTRLVGW